VAVIMSLEEYERSRRPVRKRGRSQRLRAAYGLWANRVDITGEWLADGRRRWQSERPGG
jgi:hypothetical protein